MLMKLPARCLALHIFVSYTFICAESSTMYTVLHTHNESNWSGGPAFASFSHFDWCLTHLSWKYYKVHTHWIQPASNWSGGPAIASFALLTTPTPQSKTQQNVFKLFKMPKKTVNTLPVDGADYFILLTPWFTQVVASCQNISHFFIF